MREYVYWRVEYQFDADWFPAPLDVCIGTSREPHLNEFQCEADGREALAAVRQSEQCPPLRLVKVTTRIEIVEE
jgi:hypothetical protein